MKSCYIIAEAGVNHNGSVQMAVDLIDAAVAAGADAVKFQTFKADRLVAPGARKAEYQKVHTGDGDQFAMLKALELSDSMHFRLAEHCAAKGIEFLSTPFDDEAAEFLISLGCRRLKVPSGELTNLPFIRFLASKGLPLIVSTGMADLEEVSEAISVIDEERLKSGGRLSLSEMVTLLHCTSNYPAPLHDVNLRAMQTLSRTFGLPVGYSDHTAGISVGPVARALGATVYEKHFTLDRTLPGPDHPASLEPAELAQLVRSIRDVDVMLGSDVKQPTAAEIEVRVAARRSVTVSKTIAAGEMLTADALVLMRPGDGIAPRELEQVVGRRVRRKLPAGTTLNWDDLE